MADGLRNGPQYLLTTVFWFVLQAVVDPEICYSRLCKISIYDEKIIQINSTNIFVGTRDADPTFKE